MFFCHWCHTINRTDCYNTLLVLKAFIIFFMIGSVSLTVSTTDSFARSSWWANNANKIYQNHSHFLKVAGEGLQLSSMDPQHQCKTGQ
jgi:hypothetical protein